MLALFPAPAQAEAGDYASLLLALRDQFLRGGVPEDSRDPNCWLEADGMLRKVALESFVAEPELLRLSLDDQFQPIREAVPEPFTSIDPLLLAQAYAVSEGSLKEFTKQLTRLPWKGKPNWKARPVESAVTELHKRFKRLAAERLRVSYSGRYQRATWGFNVSSAYYPLTRSLTIYAIGSAKCPGTSRSKTAVLNLKGRVDVRPGSSGKRIFGVSLDEVSFHCRGCELELAGRWTERFTSRNGGKVSVANVLSLTVKGSEVSGRLVQEIVSTTTSQKVSSGRLSYQVSGRITPEGQLDASVEAPADWKALRWMDGKAPEKIRGTLSGRVREGVGTGELSLKGFPVSLSWKAESPR